MLLCVLALAISFYGIYSARALPDWFDESSANTDYATEAINTALGKGGANLLTQKSLDILRGQVSFSEDEFNALLLLSLKADEGRQKAVKSE